MIYDASMQTRVAEARQPKSCVQSPHCGRGDVAVYMLYVLRKAIQCHSYVNRVVEFLLCMYNGVEKIFVQCSSRHGHENHKHEPNAANDYDQS